MVNGMLYLLHVLRYVKARAQVAKKGNTSITLRCPEGKVSAPQALSRVAKPWVVDGCLIREERVVFGHRGWPVRSKGWRRVEDIHRNEDLARNQPAGTKDCRDTEANKKPQTHAQSRDWWDTRNTLCRGSCHALAQINPNLLFFPPSPMHPFGPSLPTNRSNPFQSALEVIRSFHPVISLRQEKPSLVSKAPKP
jgi:hypothetical protein